METNDENLTKQKCINSSEYQDNTQNTDKNIEVKEQKLDSTENTQNIEKSNNSNKPLLEVNVEKLINQDVQKKSMVDKTLLKADQWIHSVNKIFEKYWEISCHWLCKLKNFLSQPFTKQIIYEMTT